MSEEENDLALKRYAIIGIIIIVVIFGIYSSPVISI